MYRDGTRRGFASRRRHSSSRYGTLLCTDNDIITYLNVRQPNRKKKSVSGHENRLSPAREKNVENQKKKYEIRSARLITAVTFPSTDASARTVISRERRTFYTSQSVETSLHEGTPRSTSSIIVDGCTVLFWKRLKTTRKPTQDTLNLTTRPCCRGWTDTYFYFFPCGRFLCTRIIFRGKTRTNTFFLNSFKSFFNTSPCPSTNCRIPRVSCDRVNSLFPIRCSSTRL